LPADKELSAEIQLVQNKQYAMKTIFMNIYGNICCEFSYYVLYRTLYGSNWIDLAQNKERWPALVNTVMNLRVS
jgi:hypothetical protein